MRDKREALAELGEITRLAKAWINGEIPPTKPADQLAWTNGEAPPSDPADQLARLKAELLDCQRCEIAKQRVKLVFGQGAPDAKLFIIGEGPGQQEDLSGVAFCGPSGEQLTRMLAAIDLSRDQVFISNIIKCRPPNNRNPLPEEIANCHEYLMTQLEIVKPGVILTLGAFAAKTLLNSDEGIRKLRGRLYRFNGIPLIASYHPAYLLRDPSKKPEAWQDLQMVRKLLSEL